MKKILIVILESTILTLFFTMMSQASVTLGKGPVAEMQTARSCRMTLTSLQKCAQTAVAQSGTLKLDANGQLLRVTR